MIYYIYVTAIDFASILIPYCPHGLRSVGNDFKQQAAGLAILTHLFHICEIFEK